MSKIEGSRDAVDEHRHRDLAHLTGALGVLLPHRRNMGAGSQHDVFHTKLAGLLQAPYLHALAPDAILVLHRRLEDGDTESFAR